MNKGRIADIYTFLSDALMSRLNDEEKVTVITLLRKMKPVAIEVREAVAEASQKAVAEYPSDINAAQQLVNKAVEGLLNEDVPDFTAKILTNDAFERLCFSNDWTFAQIDNLETSLVATSSQ